MGAVLTRLGSDQDRQVGPRPYFQDVRRLKYPCSIMVTGWFLFAVMGKRAPLLEKIALTLNTAYTSNTRDYRYAQRSSLLFQVTPFHKYPHSIHTMAQALAKNWKRSQYCLYACEPNWIYTTCVSSTPSIPRQVSSSLEFASEYLRRGGSSHV